MKRILQVALIILIIISASGFFGCRLNPKQVSEFSQGSGLLQPAISLTSPRFSPTMQSFFSRENTHSIFVFTVEIHDSKSPFLFSSDDASSLLSAIKDIASQKNIEIIQVSNDFFHEKWIEYEKILAFSKPIRILIIADGKLCNAELLYWWKNSIQLPRDCSAMKPQLGVTITLPKKLKGRTYKDVDYLLGILFREGAPLPDFRKLSKNKTIEKHMRTLDGQILEVWTLDLDADGVDDVLWYQERITDTAAYQRMYLNIDGHWYPKWYDWIEDCV
jgi:hypothetical protein